MHSCHEIKIGINAEIENDKKVGLGVFDMFFVLFESEPQGD